MDNTIKTTDIPETYKNYIFEVSRQVEMAFESKETPKKVKACLYSIILEASIEADLTLGDFSLVRAALPNIIIALGGEYGKGFLHSIAAILRYDTDAFREYYDKGFDLKNEESPFYKEIVTGDLVTLSLALSAVLRNETTPVSIHNAIAEALNEAPLDWKSATNILFNLQEMNKEEAQV